MVSVPRLIVYIEDLPLHFSFSARGLSKAIVPSLLALKPLTNFLVSVQCHQYYSSKSLFDFRDNSLVTGRFVHAIYRFLYKLPDIFMLAFSTLHLFFISLSLRIFCRLKYSDYKPVLFCVSGSDPFTVIRAFLLSKYLSVDLDLYLVDIFDLSISRSSSIVSRILRIAIGQCRRSYCITDGLCSLIRSEYGRKSSVLPLSTIDYNSSHNYFNSVITTNAHAFSKKILFLGSINHLYISPVRQLLDYLSSLYPQFEFSFEFVSTEHDFYKLFPGNTAPLWASYSQYSDSELSTVIAQADLCFCPYSFDPLDQRMVSTSFPSKLITYLSSAKLILVYAPHYSSAASLFIDNSLSFYASNLSEMKSQVFKILSSNISINYSSHYKSLVKSHFSRENIYSIVSKALLEK